MGHQTTVTLTPDQEKFVRENYSKITNKEMIRKLGISKSRLDNNMRLMEGINLRPRRAKVVKMHQDPDIFNVNEYRNWLLGTKYELL